MDDSTILKNIHPSKYRNGKRWKKEEKTILIRSLSVSRSLDDKRRKNKARGLQKEIWHIITFVGIKIGNRRRHDGMGQGDAFCVRVSRENEKN